MERQTFLSDHKPLKNTKGLISFRVFKVYLSSNWRR